MNRSVFAALLIAASIQYVHALTCNVSSAGLAFGIYNPASAANKDATGSVVVTCDAAVSARLILGLGQGAGASYSGGRKMRLASTTSTLTYNVYLNNTRVTVFGDGTDGSAASQLTSASTSYNRTVYGRIPASQPNIRAGSYQDTLLLTIQY